MQTERGEDMTGLGVHKIGGTSMSAVETVVDDIVIGERAGGDLYNRVFVVSAYGGMTDLLLEHKKTGEPGVYALYAGSESEADWEAAMASTGQAMREKDRAVLSEARPEETRVGQECVSAVRSVGAASEE